MAIRSYQVALVALAVVIAAAGCGKRGQQSPGPGVGGTRAPAGQTPESALHVEPGQEPVHKGETPLETALLRAKWQMERVQTAIARKETAIVTDSVSGAEAAIADARKTASRAERRKLDAIQRDIERLASEVGKGADSEATKAAVAAHKKIEDLLKG